MTPPPLAIIQARIGSQRLPGKVLLPIKGEPLIRRVCRKTGEAFGEHVVIAIPGTPENDELARVCEEFGARVFRWNGPEDDVLGRFHACAHTYRWDPASVIVRVTADDWNKDPKLMVRTAQGERLDAERGAEAFTLAMLDRAHERFRGYASGTSDPKCREVWEAFVRERREHITHALFPFPPPPPPPSGTWTIDTQEDYEAVCREVGG